ncbi:hypothetical protein GGS26DRAFT_201500 [Hypomontagnella submonticulosa]|nr:hypothetical protein GGS26DRAFT_201500 [Hypomontagnella submonticulosa]
MAFHYPYQFSGYPQSFPIPRPEERGDEFLDDGTWQSQSATQPTAGSVPWVDLFLSQAEGEQLQPWQPLYGLNVEPFAGVPYFDEPALLGNERYAFSQEFRVSPPPPPHPAFPLPSMGLQPVQPQQPMQPQITYQSGPESMTLETIHVAANSSESGFSSQTTTESNHGSEGGRKRTASPVLEPSPMDQVDGESQPQRKKGRIVGRHSCEACRRAKIKCKTHSGSHACQSCAKKGIECVTNGVDNRTNRSKNSELLQVIDDYHALVLEFVAVLHLLRPKRVGTSDEEEVRTLLRRRLTPTKILDYMQRSPLEFVQVPRVPELERYRQGYEKLEEVRKAIREAKEAGLKILCSLYTLCIEAVSDEADPLDVDMKIEMMLAMDAERGTFDSDPSDMDKKEELEELYGGVFKPSIRSLQALRTP